MQYIDKSKQKQEGDAIVDGYLDNSCRVFDEQEGFRYINIDFARFRKEAGQEFIGLLLRNQSNYCCYCMRELHSIEQVSLEHIIPQRVKEEELDYYRSAPNLSEDEVVLTQYYVKADDQHRPPYPHLVAYNNLVASCDGAFDDGTQQLSCNHQRGNRMVLPLFYWSGVLDWIKYTPNGEAISVAKGDMKKNMEQLIDRAGLNCNMLKDIRRLWYVLKNEALADLYNCTNDERLRELILSKSLFKNANNVDSDYRILEKFRKQNYWIKLMGYTYFYDYYRRVKP